MKGCEGCIVVSELRNLLRRVTDRLEKARTEKTALMRKVRILDHKLLEKGE